VTEFYSNKKNQKVVKKSKTNLKKKIHTCCSKTPGARSMELGKRGGDAVIQTRLKNYLVFVYTYGPLPY
jgi:hypothetical protein